VEDTAFEVHSEHHGPHEIVMDWTMTVKTSLFPTYPLSLRMRSHILLEPPGKKGEKKEKIFRIFEEWNGNTQLNEQTTLIPVVGKMHRLLRQYTGAAGAWAVKNGYM